jgi:L-type amino acid transporter 5
MAAFGPLSGFLFVWSQLIIIIPTANAVAALTFADYILQPIYSTCEPPYSARVLIAAAAVLILTILNCVSVKWVTRIQNVFSTGKILALLIIVGMGCYCLISGRTQNFHYPNIMEGSDYSIGKISVAFYSGLFCYAGWSYLNFVVEEVKEPNKTLPRSIWLGLIIVIVVYTFTNVAYFTLLTPREMLASNAVAVTFAEKLIGKGSFVVSIFVALSTFGFVNSILLSTSRIIFGAARNNHMPTILAFINIRFLTPIVSVIFMSVATLICLLFQDTFVLLRIGVLAEYLFIAISVAGLLYLRKIQPNTPRPIKVNLFYPYSFLIICLFIIMLTLYQKPLESIICLAIIALGIPVFWLGVKWEKPKSVQQKLGL